MRLLQLDPNGDEATALDLHPLVTVVTDLSATGRHRLLRAASALPGARDPGTPGLIEAHGILLDLSTREKVILYPLVVLVIFFGVYPAPIFDVTTASVDSLLHNVSASLDAAKTALAN